MSDEPRQIGPLVAGWQERIRHLAEHAASRHATDPEPVGRVRDLDGWREGQWRRAVPKKFHAARLDHVRDLHGQEIADDLAMWVDCTVDRPNLILFGPVGVGKTYAAVAALRPLHDRGSTVAVWPVTTLLEATSPGGVDPAGALASAIDADVLLLDDLGMERGTEWAAERIYEVVNRRWLDSVPTIVTTNVPGPDAMVDAVGERVWSRLQDGAVALRLGGSDRRRTR